MGTTPVVGVGVGRGGREALRRFLGGIPSEFPACVILVSGETLTGTADPLTELAGFTSLPVRMADSESVIEPGTVLLVPEGGRCTLDGEALVLSTDDPAAPGGMPADVLFRSLAGARGRGAIAVILAGEGSDGSLGLRALGEVGGVCLVQAGARGVANEMLRSARSTGMIDLSLTPEALAGEVHALLEARRARLPDANETSADRVESLLRLVHLRTGRDFTLYKRNTLLRRIEKRLLITRCDDLASYLRYAEEEPGEVRLLLREFLIGVTCFFRDREVFATLREAILPSLVRRAGQGRPLRIWVPACSTGEEAYSLAILLHQALQEQSPDASFQIFATDVDEDAIVRARQGLYPANIVADVPETLLNRFFLREGGAFRILPALRDRVVFAPHSVVDDPPFSRLDLLSCRNLLIYLGAELQRRVLALFHYALRPDGFLVLGSSESVGPSADLFQVVDGESKIYNRLDAAYPTETYRAFERSLVHRESPGPAEREPNAEEPSGVSYRDQIERVLGRRYAPAAVLVGAQGQVLYVHGSTGRFLQPAPGAPSQDILRMVRDELRGHLLFALQEVREKDTPVRRQGLRYHGEGETTTLDLVVEPFEPPSGEGGLVLILFETSRAWGSALRGAAPSLPVDEQADYVEALERQIRGQDESLQTTIEDLKATNEEVQAANEELQAANEELQSTNEELETSREELQALNVELTTVNAELHEKNSLAVRSENDLANLLAATEVAAVFLDLDLAITRFTPAARSVIHLIDTDVGRPLGDFATELPDEDLVAAAQRLLEDLVPVRREVRTRSGLRYHMRILPYRTSVQAIEGVVLVFLEMPERGSDTRQRGGRPS